MSVTLEFAHDHQESFCQQGTALGAGRGDVSQKIPVSEEVRQIVIMFLRVATDLSVHSG